MKTAVMLFTMLGSWSVQDKTHDAFLVWWRQFQTAVSQKDVATVTKGSRFPMQWENGPTREVKATADFSMRFDFYFTPEIKRMISTRFPVAEGRDSRTITWKARGNEYSL